MTSHVRTRIIALLGSLMLVCVLSTFTTSPAQAKYGTNLCGSNFRTARAVLNHSILGISVYGIESTCAAKNRYGTKYIQWTNTPHPSFIANSSLGHLQSVDITWGPYMTRAEKTRQSPWHYPCSVCPTYMAWSITQAALGKPKIYRTTRVVHTFTARICTISIAGTHECSDGDYKIVNKIYYGLRVCSLEPEPRCGAWKRFS